MTFDDLKNQIKLKHKFDEIAYSDVMEICDWIDQVEKKYVEKSGITGDYVGVQTDDREFKLVPVKRNKQVDVPTEAWQKDMERKLARAEETLVILCAYLTSTNTIDMNDWNKYLQLSRGY